jgi:hypothetical protein
LSKANEGKRKVNYREAEGVMAVQGLRDVDDEIVPPLTPASLVRLRRAPLLDPGYDDERVHRPATDAVELPIDWGSAGSPMVRPVRQRRGAELHAADDVPRTGAFAMLDGPAPSGGSGRADRATSHGVLGTAAGSAERYVRLCLEVLNGFRPAAHLRTLAGAVEFGDVVSQLSRRRNGIFRLSDRRPARGGVPINRGSYVRHGLPDNQGPAKPVATPPANAVKVSTAAVPVGAGARRNVAGATQPFRLLKMHLSEPRDGVAEAVAVLAYGGTTVALAMRLERHSGQWLCALAQVV